MRKCLTVLLLFFLAVALKLDAQTGGVSAFAVQPLTGLNVQVRPGTININGVPTLVNVTNVAVPANATTYIFLTSLGAVSSNQIGFSGGAVPLAIVTTGPNFVISVVDQRTDYVMAGSGVSPSSPVPAAQAQGPQFNVVNYSGGLTIKDAAKTNAAITTNASSTITDATNSPFLSTDVNKKIFCIGAGGNSALSTTISTISAFNSTSSISISPATGNGNSQNPSTCVWFSNKATAAFLAAGAAAKVAAGTAVYTSIETTQGGEVYCPDGGYVVDGPFYVQSYANGNTLGVSFIGAGNHHCRIYMSPDVAVSNQAMILSSIQAYGTQISGFSYDCSGLTTALAPAGMMHIQNAGALRMSDIDIFQCGTSGDSSGLIFLQSSGPVTIDGLKINNSGLTSTAEPGIGVSTAAAGIRIRNYNTSNPGSPGSIVFSGACGQAFAGGPRTVLNEGCLVESSVFDEGGNAPGAVAVTNGSSVSFVGVTFVTGTTTALSVDGTSSAYLADCNLVPFNGTNAVRQAITIASGGYVYATGTEIQGGGANGAGLSAAVSGPAGATFVSAGGNTIRNCQGVLPCPLVTAANFTTQGFNGGIVPKSSETHTPNTCYAVTGNLLATAQNLCQFLNDQNYQLLNITAQSGGTTPANSSCATPPVITLSDGTRSATMTMTSGKAAWSSAVDAVTNINQVFASGATLTISIGANTCATPPVNVAVSYIVQSVLNQ